MNQTLSDIRGLVAQARAEELPRILAALEEARAEAWVRLTAEAARPPEPEYLTVEEACASARMPRRRLYSLARGAPWAVRVGRRLVVEKNSFVRWLHVRGRHEHARKGRRAVSRMALASTRASQTHGLRFMALR